MAGGEASAGHPTEEAPTERTEVPASSPEVAAKASETIDAAPTEGPPAPVALPPGEEDALEVLPPEDAFRAYLADIRPTEDIEAGAAESSRVELELPIRAVVDLAGRGLGRVTHISTGSLWVETHQVQPVGTSLTVEETLLGGHTLALHGVVVRSASAGMGIRLETDDSTWVFRSSFVELAKSTKLGRRPEVRVRRRLEGGETADLAPLWAWWRKAEGAPHDDEAQQRFIQACLVRRRLEFALERYRAARAAHPGHEAPERYLQQIGTLLGFSSMAPVDKEELGQRARLMKSAAIGLVLLCLGLLLARWVGGSRAEARPPLDEGTFEQVILP